MKNAFILSLLVVMLEVSIFAVDYKEVGRNIADTAVVPQVINKPYAKDYILIGKGKWDNSIEQIVKSDPLFDQGNKMLSDPAYFVKKTVLAELDPEKFDKTTKVASVADYENGIKKLAESAKTFQNPVSAYEAVMMSIKMYGKGAGNPIASDMHILTKLMYINEVCEGYLLHGEMLEKSGNNAMAYEVYKKGSENQKCTGWYQSVIGGKMSTFKRSLGK